jgi:CheY-like chemotaxis protein
VRLTGWVLDEKLRFMESRSWKVLLIDDSEISVELVASILNRKGFDVRFTTRLDEFDTLLVDWSPDVILTDVDMPGVTGVELCQRLKNYYDTSGIPIVLLSSLPAETLAELARTCEADGYLSKLNGSETLPEELDALCANLVW